jgi:putative ABC transport system ATP-binding protein
LTGAAVVVDGVAKAFENGRIVALRDVGFTVEPGELVAITGPSGGGKSTLLNLIGALDRPDAGTIVVDGEHVERLHDPSAYRSRTVGFVFQFHHLIPTLTAAENVQLPLLGTGLARSARAARAAERLAEVGLAHRAAARPGTLSGGERQRVALARALVNGPRLLLADEPTGALDTQTSDQIVELLQALRARRGTTILLVTNDPQVAERADRTLQIRDGAVVAATRAEAPRSA